MFSVADKALEPLLKLADEYDVGHVKKKCEHFIGDQIQFVMNTEQAMRYLWLCDVYQLLDHKDHLTALAADHTLESLTASKYYSLLQATAQRDVMEARCRFLQDEKDQDKLRLMNTGRLLRRMRSAIHRLPALVMTLPDKCPGIRCLYCPNKLHSSNYSYCSCSPVSASFLQGILCKCCVLDKTVLIIHCLDQMTAPFKKNFPKYKQVEFDS